MRKATTNSINRLTTRHNIFRFSYSKLNKPAWLRTVHLYSPTHLSTMRKTAINFAPLGNVRTPLFFGWYASVETVELDRSLQPAVGYH